MENAVKALLIAAGVLIGLMIISLGVTLFSSLNQYTDETQRKIEENALQAFNEKFTRYINCEDDSSAIPEFKLTIQDIVTVANIAYENNKNYGLDSAESYNYYVTINMPGKNNLEKSINDSNSMNQFNSANLLKANIKKEYKCTYSCIKINENTGRVCEVTFQEYNP